MSIVILILFMLCLAGIVYYPGKLEAVNGIERTIVGAALLVCAISGVGIMFYRVHLPVGCMSIGIVLAICTAGLWYGIYRSGNRQAVYWRKTDIIIIIAFTAVVSCIAIVFWGTEQKFPYANELAAHRFGEAMHVVRGQDIGEIHLATITEAMTIEIFRTFFGTAMSYKGYMYANLFMLLLEGWLFYVVTVSISSQKIVRVFAPVFLMGYFGGYPIYNYMVGNDDFFSMRSICVLLCIYVFNLPIWSVEKSRTKTLLYRVLLIGAIMCMIGLNYRYSLSGALGGDMKYASMYGDLVFFVPAAIYVCCNVLVKRKRAAICTISIAMLGYILFLYSYWFDNVISNYDYYQNYAMLWLLGWLLAVQALEFSAENKELPQFFSYAAFIIALAVLVLSGFADRASLGLGDGQYVTKSFFSLYRNNQLYLRGDYEKSEAEDTTLKLYDYVLSSHGGKDVPILTENAAERAWYDALTDNDSAIYNMKQYELPELLELLEQNNVNVIVVQKDKTEYEEYQEYFHGCEMLYETKTAALYQMPSNGWLDVSDMNVENYEQKQDLYEYITANFGEEQIPLMAAEASYLDFILYESVTGRDSSNFYTWQYSGREGIENLNEHDVKYVVLLKDDDYCARTCTYYDTQEIIYENEAGKIVHCIGNQWILE